ncbi:hypothetical protein [Capnocytophaga sp. H2931]|uniref:hypothetical protein n=1 Tax=Capnocytophaga sp. H2931 TaxID=1945657 RepID=UPI000BB1D9B0|nr:hypothetical protein [Capnocytophaga sp. H2931]ATA75122.1 hypothetical protein CGC52_06635 [Capnocytophaga sp. H2931]
MKSNTLFKFYEPEDLININGKQFSHFGWEGKGAFAFFLYAESYKSAAELLYEKMKTGNNADIDTLIYPLCFNYRHCMEMLLKYLYIKYSKTDENGLKSFLNANHNLNKIWKDIKPILEQNINKVGSKIDINVMENYVIQMHDFDDKSMTMRYPITKKLDANKTELRLDYHNFHIQMLCFYNSILQLDSDIDNQINYQASKEDFDLFIEKYKLAKNNVLEFIKIIQPFADIDKAKLECDKLPIKSSNINWEELLGENSEYTLTRKYLDNLPSDDKIIIEVLYYAGRDVASKRVTLSKSPKKKIEDFINFCIFQMKTIHPELKFGEKVPFINTQTKSSNNIIKYIRNAMSILDSDFSYNKDNI